MVSSGGISRTTRSTTSTSTSSNNSNNHNNNNKERSPAAPLSNNKNDTASNSKKAKYSHAATTTTSTSSNHTKKQQSPKTTQSVLVHPRKNAEIVIRGKQLWNLLRCKRTNTPEQIRQYMDELLPLIRGKVTELSMQHDASRIVQAAIQFANETERQAIVSELCLTTTSNSNSSTGSSHYSHNSDQKKGGGGPSVQHTFLDLCQSQYAHFVIIKIIQYCAKDPVCVALLINAMKGNILKLVTHVNGSRIMEALFQSTVTTSSNSSSSGSSSTTKSATTTGTNILSLKTTAILKQEIYGPHYATFAQDTLQQLVTMVQEQQHQQQQSKGKGKESPNTKTKTATTTTASAAVIVPTLALNIALLPEKKQMTMEHIKNYIILKGIDKQLYGYNYFHTILYEYIAVLLTDQSYHTIRNLCSTTNITDHCIHLLSSKVGTKVVCTFIAYSTVKERKRIIKSLKGYSQSAIHHKDAYLAMIQLLLCMDDTVALYKNILQELVLVNTTTNTSNNQSNVIGTTATAKKSEDKYNHHNHQSPSPLLDMALSDTASKFLLVMLAPPTATGTTATGSIEPTATTTTTTMSVYSKILDPHEQEVLSPFHPYIMEKVSNTNNDNSNNEATTSTSSNALQKVYTSKKDPETRRHELLSYFHIPLLQQLVVDDTTMQSLLVSVSGSNVLYHLYVATIQKCRSVTTTSTGSSNDNSAAASKQTGGANPTIHQLSQLLKDMIHAICSVCRQNLIASSSSSKSINDSDETSSSASGIGNIFEHVVGHRIIKNLIIYDATLHHNDVVTTATTTSDDSIVRTFTDIFVQEFASDFKSMMQYNRGAFILVALLQHQEQVLSSSSSSTTVRDRVIQHLHIPSIIQEQPEQSSKNGHEQPPKSTPGLIALRQEINKALLKK